MDKITTEQIGELIEQSKGENPRINRENLQAFLRNPNAFLRADVYPVVVDCGKSIEEMVLAGHYDRQNNDINSKNFMVWGDGVANIDLELVHPDKAVSSDDVFAHFNKNGMRPATIEELLVFGSTYPEIQREFPIICLGSSWVDPGGDRYVCCLGMHGYERCLYLYWRDIVWRDNCRFLAVRN